jgi:hypothetical protein
VYGEGYYKIGLTQSPKHRMKALQSSVPFPLTCVYLISTVFMWQTEALLHTTFAAKRIKGEWFALAEGDLAWIRLTFPPAGDPHATASL